MTPTNNSDRPEEPEMRRLTYDELRNGWAISDRTELLPCPLPWCSKSKPVLAQGGFRNGSYRVQCETCGCAGPRFYDPRKAIAAWNERTSLEADKRELVEALDLARNRLRAAAINEAPKQSRVYYDYSQWADEADATLTKHLTKGEQSG